MAQYELVREIFNLCPNNQMRDVFFDEVQTHDPEDYVRAFLKDAPDGTVGGQKTGRYGDCICRG